MENMTGAAAAAVHDFTVAGLFMQADPVVKGVMIALVAASVASWAIILDRGVRLALLRREIARFEAMVRAAATPIPGRQDHSLAAVANAGLREAQDRSEDETRGEARERCERAMRIEMMAKLRTLEPGLPFLGTVGSTAPFVGLFGTVWGIMNSFSSIAQSNDTSLAVVAPGIAEALFATALGLAAAIPAVVAYNKLTTSLGRIGQRMTAAIGELAVQLIRKRGARGAEAAEAAA